MCVFAILLLKMEYPDVDARNIPRGRCKDLDCLCLRYDGASSRGKKCACLHPPGKHVNLSLPVCEVCGLNTPPDFKYCTPMCRNKALNRGDFGTIDISALEQSLEPIEIKTCRAKDCSNIVYWDYRMEFLYCSPKCRDNHLLEENRELLQREIKKMEDEIVSMMKSQQYRTCQTKESPVDKPHSGNGKMKNSSGAAGTTSSQEQRHCFGGGSLVAGTPDKHPLQTTTGRGQLDQDGRRGNEQKIGNDDTNKCQAADTRDGSSASKELGENMRMVRSKGNEKKLTKDSTRKKEAAGASFASLPPSRHGPKGCIKYIDFNKDKHMDHGIIVCDVLWPDMIDGRELQGFLITGIKLNKQLKAFKKMQDCQLRIFDIIVAVNDKLVKDYLNDNSPQEVLDSLLNKEEFVRLRIYCPYYSLKTTNDIIAMMKFQKMIPTHIIAVVYPGYYPKGLSIRNNSELELSDDKVFTVHSTEELRVSAELCGLKNGDKYVFSVKGLHSKLDVVNSLCCHDHDLKKIKQQFFEENVDLILAIVR